ncbi:MAG TPA: TonB family protein [Verrucomicrobiae bacterium]|jgi:TonB family protein|nr:TonB family protein [Verrucomicrobiae bacterium]
MKVFWLCLLISLTPSAQSQTASTPPLPPGHYPSVADFGLAYPLSNDWVRATGLLRKKLESSIATPDYDVLLAAFYLTKSDLSVTNPFFSLVAYRQPASDCKKSLEAMIARFQDQKDRPEGDVLQFSAAGRDYFRVNRHRGAEDRYQVVICTIANNHMLIWNAGAPDQEGLDAIVATLNSITALPPSTGESTGSAAKNDREAEGHSAQPVIAKPERVRVSGPFVQGLLIKKVNPIYPAEARAARIQGTVILQAEISKTGDITDLELVDGPIELAGSAIVAVRQWKYRPYLLLGQPVIVQTQVQVNYQLQ